MIAIDLFAGLGGFTEGARQVGVHVAFAANHWPTAVEWHAANHPGTVHACQDLQQADFRDAPAHDLLLASPACQGHSPARGKEKPHHADGAGQLRACFNAYGQCWGGFGGLDVLADAPIKRPAKLAQLEMFNG